MFVHCYYTIVLILTLYGAQTKQVSSLSKNIHTLKVSLSKLVHATMEAQENKHTLTLKRPLFS